jgi:TatD DNase family protein
MLIDTHCHLDMMVQQQCNVQLSREDVSKIEQIIKEAADATVQQIVTIGTNAIENQHVIQLAETFPTIFAAIGLHPNECKTNWHHELDAIKKSLCNKKIVAIGECGLDFHRPNFDKKCQQDAFKAQIELALEHDLALIVHTRDAYDETMKLLEPYNQSLSRVVMHCFSENMTAAKEIISFGFLLGIGGIITYPKNNELRSIISAMGLDHIVLETDAPFLPPQIIRGKQNHPKYIAVIAHYIAQHLQVPYAEVERITTNNAQRLFARTPES